MIETRSARWEDPKRETVFPPPPQRDTREFRSGPSTVLRVSVTELTIHDLQRLHNAVDQIHSIFPNCIITVEKRINDSATKRGKVLAATKHAPATVAQIAKMTGMKPGEIRGVLSASDLEFRRERIGGLIAYEFIRTRRRSRGKWAVKQ